jgi:hypothetical protein
MFIRVWHHRWFWGVEVPAGSPSPGGHDMFGAGKGNKMSDQEIFLKNED